MSGFKSSRKEFQKIVEAHKRYLENYKVMNNGSLKGATPFNEFYTFWTYTTRYADMRLFALITYR